MPLLDRLRGAGSMKGDDGVVHLERADRAYVQVWKIARHFPINPELCFAIVLSRRVGFDHQFVAVPAA